MKTEYYPYRQHLFFIPIMILGVILSVFLIPSCVISRMYFETSLLVFFAASFVITTVFLYDSGITKIVFDDNGVSVIKRKSSRFYSWDNLTHCYVWYVKMHTYALLSDKQLDYSTQKRIVNRATYVLKENCDEYLTVFFCYAREGKKLQQIKNIIIDRFPEIEFR